MAYRILCLCSILLFCGCPDDPDTCNAVLGDTFSDVSIEAANLESERLTLNLALLSLDTLPGDYFAGATVLLNGIDPDGEDIGTDGSATTVLQSNENRLALSINAPAWSDDLVRLLIRYPDRRDHIPCEHPGSGDRYMLYLRFNVEGDEVTNFFWEEDFRPGGL